MPTDLPEPVVPATSRCGILARSATTGWPPMSLPSTTVSGECASWYTLEPMISDRRTICRFGLGSSSAMQDLPGTVSTTRIDTSDSAREVLGKVHHLAALDPGCRLDLVASDHRAGVGGEHLDLDAEVGELGLDQPRGELEGFGRRRLHATTGRIEQCHRRD